MACSESEPCVVFGNQFFGVGRQHWPSIFRNTDSNTTRLIADCCNNTFNRLIMVNVCLYVYMFALSKVLQVQVPCAMLS